MAVRFCPFCGQPVVPGGTFCASCGASLVGSAAPAGTPGIPPAFQPLGVAPILQHQLTSPLPGGPTLAPPSADLNTLSSVATAALLSLIGNVIGLVALFGTPGVQALTVSTSTSGTKISLDSSSLLIFGAVLAVSVVLTFLELIYFRIAFKKLQPYDERFSTPAKLVLILLMALPIVLLAAVALLYLVSQAIVCAGPGNFIPPACLNGGDLLGVLGILAVGGILALAGYIGLLLGIWRLGSRYESTALKVGAVLLIFPLLNLVAAILILVSARSTRAQIASGSSAATFG
ncbi:MAG: DUF973 family protein [Thermoplasmata archaeon]